MLLLDMGTNLKNSFDEQQQKETNDAIMENHESLESFTNVGFKMLVEATKKSNVLPSGKARDLYECYPSFHSVIEQQADYVLSMLSDVLKKKNYRGNMKNRDDEDKFEMIVDVNDSLMEKVGIALDELSGVRKLPETQFASRKLQLVNGSWNKDKTTENKMASQVLNKILSQTKNIEKPQLKFKDKINNDSDVPFEPKIKYKYNMLKPLACLLEVYEDSVSQYTHPYEFELEKFKPLPEQMKHVPPIKFKSLDETPLIMVNTPEDVIKMVDYLETLKEIAVDLEHHSYRSFQGFTCLMQISSRDKDFIIDTIALRSDLEILNKVFTNPSIVKVFHGADMDVLWLQRDLALYVVNMFDTHQAAKLLKFPKLSLSYFLALYCNVQAQKQYQLADWRIRPLPEELVNYAREDTHYLLYIYDNLRNALIEKANNKTNMLESVIAESTRICLKRYIKPIYKEDGYLDLYHRSKKLFDNRQKFALQRLYEWRDKYARESDESYSYTLPDHMMLNISEVLPREAQGILACCNPIPVPVRQNLLVLHQMIIKAREQPLIKPVLEEQRFYKFTSSNVSENPLQCPHDVNKDEEFRDDLPVLLSGSNQNSSDRKLNPSEYICSKPIINIFTKSTQNYKENNSPDVIKGISVTPYHRYKLSKQFAESVESKNLNANLKENAKKLEQNSRQSEKNKEGDSNAIKNQTIENKDGDETNEKRALNKRLGGDAEATPAKKSKKDEVENEEEKVESQPAEQLKKKKAKPFRRKAKEFKPFDYNSVDYKKYQSSDGVKAKKIQKKSGKTKRKSGKKNFKISV